MYILPECNAVRNQTLRFLQTVSVTLTNSSTLKTVCQYNHVLELFIQHEIEKFIEKVSQMLEDVKARYEQYFLVMLFLIIFYHKY